MNHLIIKFQSILLKQSPIFTGVTTEISEKAITDLYDVFSVIDTYYFDNGNEWIAGESITVADFAYVATISTLLVLFNETNKKSNCKSIK